MENGYIKCYLCEEKIHHSQAIFLSFDEALEPLSCILALGISASKGYSSPLSLFHSYYRALKRLNYKPIFKYVPLCPECFSASDVCIKTSKIELFSQLFALTTITILGIVALWSANILYSSIWRYEIIPPPLIPFIYTPFATLLIYLNNLLKARKRFWSPDDDYKKSVLCVHDGREAFCRCALCYKPLCRDCFTITTPTGLFCEECTKAMTRIHRISLVVMIAVAAISIPFYIFFSVNLCINVILSEALFNLSNFISFITSNMANVFLFILLIISLAPPILLINIIRDNVSLLKEYKPVEAIRIIAEIETSLPLFREETCEKLLRLLIQKYSKNK